ncbi:MAG: 23S rRNA (adenine(2503)-C(2))-methyltransferase RlmN, partial [bacterium]
MNNTQPSPSFRHDLRELSLDDLKDVCFELNFSKFKAKEIFKFVHQKLGEDLDNLTTIKLSERELLKEYFFISKLTPAKVQKDKMTEKVTFELEDGNIIETVFMDNTANRKTVCVSSQVGCP